MSEAEFRNGVLRDMTKMGCGYDFSIIPESRNEFIAIEVKGTNGKSGGICVTEKEYLIAEFLKDRYFLYIVGDVEVAGEVGIGGRSLDISVLLGRERGRFPTTNGTNGHE